MCCFPFLKDTHKVGGMAALEKVKNFVIFVPSVVVFLGSVHWEEILISTCGSASWGNIP